MLPEETKVIDENQETETKNDPEPTKEEIAMNQKLLEADAKIVRLEKEKRALEDAAREKSLNEILEKKGIKKEFQEFAKFKLQWQEISDLDKATDDFIKNNPALIEQITSGGNGDTKINNETDNEKPNILLEYQKENFL
ncbi:hypothetical protein LT336_00751 [Spiroplasma sp. JKS002671]|nr:hypothetical protein [Spiroplasma sp. JKS002671]MCL8210999.1 hypothetical protein [Spiroplasma sp. JKS002671]